jgi:hypothetical protein
LSSAFARISRVIGLIMTAGIMAQADFSYLVTEKVSGGLIARMVMMLDTTCQILLAGAGNGCRSGRKDYDH